ncbi:MAG TPA: cbb3-type cytochrome c oxidase subunit II [Capsulimonadaceae bacterium]|nr:cbb3-type cytochrome c oxidase subunit II [Capsulimonadaceae bacterium]
MAGPKAEQSSLWLGIFIGCTYLGGLVFTAITPSFNNNWSLNTAQDTAHYHVPYTAQQLRGRLVYEREGCMYCHTQQIRPLTSEMIRYGIGSSPAVAADEREYVYDEPHFLGTKRNGPDLSRVGGKYSDDWQYSHLWNPPMLTPGSIMPAFTWLFQQANPADPSSVPEPNQDCKDLVAYLQTLGSERQIYDQSLNGGKGGWRPWLKPQDALFSQQAGEAAVNQAGKNAVRVQGGTSATPAQ